MNLINEKPLFIPLKKKYYQAFKKGTKTVEYRKYGKRWNEKTCFVGRDVTLSLGYGKKDRMTGKVTKFEIVGLNANKDLQIIYPDTSQFAAITLQINNRN